MELDYKQLTQYVTYNYNSTPYLPMIENLLRQRLRDVDSFWEELNEEPVKKTTWKCGKE